MARDFAAGTDKIVTEVSVHATLRSYSCWMWWDTKGGNNEGRLFDKREAGAAVEMVSFYTATGQPFAYRRVWSSATGIWKWDTDPTSGAWHHVGVTYDAEFTSNDPVLFLDGVPVASTELQAPVGAVTTNTDKYVLGNRGAGNRGWDGRQAELGVWDRILSDAEMAALGKGASPLNFPDALVMPIPLVRDVIDYMNDNPTVTGTTVIEHPPKIFYPGSSQIGLDAAAVGATTRDLAGDQPAATGTLTRVEQDLRALAGAQPASAGTLARMEQALRALAGDQPNATGILARIFGRPRSQTGDQPESTGDLAAVWEGVRALAGAQLAAAGTLATKLTAFKSLVGDQTAATGILTRIRNSVHAITGSQPAATGDLARQ
ncbi:hypothetical protein LCGC14_2323050, partial [marine sediment metagenome]